MTFGSDKNSFKYGLTSTLFGLAGVPKFTNNTPVVMVVSPKNIVIYYITIFDCTIFCRNVHMYFDSKKPTSLMWVENFLRALLVLDYSDYAKKLANNIGNIADAVGNA